MNIKNIHRNWTELGAEDPMWAVLTDPAKKGNKWEENEFFETGRIEIRGVMEKLSGIGMPVHPGRALDFGCGVGRLSQALAGYFASVDGVDVSASMIERANGLNKHPEKVKYHLNVKEDLSAFPSHRYDFIYSNICLQHIPTQYQASYISEFMRLLKPGALAHFQTVEARGWRRLIPNWVADLIRRVKHKGKPCIPLYGISAERVLRIIDRHGCTVARQESDPYAGWESRYSSDIFIVSGK
jgi:2-polyprenyl-3-methyl-5-hydroxy-6-metoxy-1,4-benzoquinol methylase